MIRNKLSELLAERHLKISRVANDIEGLSRNTITATAQNRGKMIQLETIDKLCQYLDVGISDFFEYVPFDIDVNCDRPELIDNLKRDNFSNILTNKIKVLPFEIDLFLVKKINSKDFGTKKETYELTARVNEPFYVDVYEDDYDYSPVADIEILFGQSENSTSSYDRKKFENFISNLSNGIKEMIFNKISREINKKINSALVDEDLPEMAFNLRFTFNKFTNNKNIKEYMYLIDGDDNAKTSEICDDDLPF